MKDSIQYQLATMPDECCDCGKCHIVTRKERERGMKAIGLGQGDPLLNLDETQIVDTSELWDKQCLESDERDANVTDRLPTQ